MYTMCSPLPEGWCWGHAVFGLRYPTAINRPNDGSRLSERSKLLARDAADRQQYRQAGRSWCGGTANPAIVQALGGQPVAPMRGKLYGAPVAIIALAWGSVATAQPRKRSSQRHSRL